MHCVIMALRFATTVAQISTPIGPCQPTPISYPRFCVRLKDRGCGRLVLTGTEARLMKALVLCRSGP